MKINNFVLDTNIWISAIITNSETTLCNLILNNILNVFICKEMIDEIEDVLNRKKLQKYLSVGVPEYIFQILRFSNLVAITQKYNQAPDKDDNYLYDLCLTTKSVLVTGDKLLLSYVSNPPITAITRFEFFSKF